MNLGCDCGEEQLKFAYAEPLTTITFSCGAEREEWGGELLNLLLEK